MLASLEIESGRVYAQVTDNRRSETFLKFMDGVVKQHPGKRLHIVLDNLNTHTNQAAKDWLASNPLVSFSLYSKTCLLGEPDRVLLLHPDEARATAGSPPIRKRTGEILEAVCEEIQ